MRSSILGLLLALAISPFALAVVVTNTNDSGAGSLRQAILDVNAGSGFIPITFSIGSGAQVITPLTPLPVITKPVRIDARTQPGYAGVPLITIDGSASGGTGLEFAPGLTDSEVWALAIRGFATGLLARSPVLIYDSYFGRVNGGDGNGVGIAFTGNYFHSTVSGSVISGNTGDGITIATGIDPTQPVILIIESKIGTDPSGSTALPNGGHGIAITSGRVSVSESVISGNVRSGIHVEGLTANGLLSIANNVIGTNAAGTAALPNQESGIHLERIASGSYGLLWNVISGNAGAGVRIIDSSGIDLFGNHIGVSETGAAIPNGGRGVHASGSSDIEIGLLIANRPNVISGNAQQGILIDGGGSSTILGARVNQNGGHGIELSNAANVRIETTEISANALDGIAVTGASAVANDFVRNTIFANGGLAIDLENDGVTPNDPLDADSGANRRQNFPLLQIDGSGLLRITMATAPNRSVRVEVFRLTGSSMTFEREVQMTTDSAGNAVADITVPLGAWQYVATATTVDGTSELSAPAQELAAFATVAALSDVALLLLALALAGAAAAALR